MKEAAVVRVLSIVVALASWGVLSAGFATPASPDPMADLDAGGGFDVFVSVFLPWCALTLMIVGVSLVGAFLRALGVAAALTGATTVGFGLYVLTRQPLLDSQPAMASIIWFSILLASVAILFAGVATAVRQETGAVTTDEATPARTG